MASPKKKCIPMANWGNIPKELATKIAEHIVLNEDFETFGWVCSCWRSAFKDATFRAESVDYTSSSTDKHNVPWLMLPETNETTMCRRFYSFSKKMVRRINLPNIVLPDNARIDGIKLLSSHGWLFLHHLAASPYLLNPISGATISLPHIWGCIRFEKFVLSANPSTTSDFMIFLSSEELVTSLYVWRNGDKRWKPVFANHIWQKENTCQDFVFYQGSLYGVFFNGEIVKFRTNKHGDDFRVTIVELKRLKKCYDKLIHNYLVESDGKLLIVRRVRGTDGKNYLYTEKFVVMELNVENGEVKEVQSIGNRSIFIGSNSSFSLDVSVAPGCFMPNCIYFTHARITSSWNDWDDFYVNKDNDNGAFDLAMGKIDRFSDGSLVNSKLTPPMWVESS